MVVYNERVRASLTPHTEALMTADSRVEHLHFFSSECKIIRIDSGISLYILKYSTIFIMHSYVFTTKRIIYLD